VKALIAARESKRPSDDGKVSFDGAGRPTTSPPGTGSTCGPRIPSRARSPRSGLELESPRGRAARTPDWRWCSSYCRPPRAADGRSTARTWSPWSGPARNSRRASGSNDPTRHQTRRLARESTRSPPDHALTGDPQKLTIPREPADVTTHGVDGTTDKRFLGCSLGLGGRAATHHRPLTDRSRGRRLVHPSSTRDWAHRGRPRANDETASGPTAALACVQLPSPRQAPGPLVARRAPTPSGRLQHPCSWAGTPHARPCRSTGAARAQPAAAGRSDLVSGSQPQPAQLPHQPAAADPKLSPHPLDRPALRDALCLQVGRQILEAQFYQPRHPTRLPAHRLHPTPQSAAARCCLAAVRL
jgi:hypothetical protein